MTDWKKLALSKGRPLIMGILNVTPDSFSDGMFVTKEAAMAHAFEMIDAGADIVDVGGESTRPGSLPVPAEVELERIIPVIEDLAPSAGVPVSVDTMKASVAGKAIDAGASMVNDVLGLRGEGMLELVASAGIPAVIMHMHGSPYTLASDLMVGDAVGTVKAFLRERASAAMEAGMRSGDMIMDPGIGFGTTRDQSMEILQRCSEFGMGHPVLVGPSRKRFLSYHYPGMDRDAATAEACRTAMKSGADIVRVHNVAAVKAALEGFRPKS